MGSQTGEIQIWDGKTNSHKECYEHYVLPTIQESSVLNFLDWCQFAIENYMDEYPMLRKMKI